MQKKCSVIILAGGKSERMNFPKPYLGIDRKTFIEKIIETYLAFGITEIIAVMNKDFCEGKWEKYLRKISSKIMIIKNTNSESGRFHSLKLGLQNLSENMDCFVQPVDNPFVNEEILNLLWESKKNDGFVSPVFGTKGGHPILLSKTMIKEIETIEDEDINLKEIFTPFLKHKVIMNDGLVLRNINTPEDYDQFVNKNL